jgi:hypothetical protein
MCLDVSIGARNSKLYLRFTNSLAWKLRASIAHEYQARVITKSALFQNQPQNLCIGRYSTHNNSTAQNEAHTVASHRHRHWKLTGDLSCRSPLPLVPPTSSSSTLPPVWTGPDWWYPVLQETSSCDACMYLPPRLGHHDARTRDEA